MIHTDGKPTIASPAALRRPVHGGYPTPTDVRETVARWSVDVPRADAIPTVAPVWETRTRADVTFSLAAEAEAVGALAMAEATLDARGYGYTVIRTRGAWQGAREYGAVISLVGDAIYSVPALVRTLTTCGCEAVQVETWDRDGYRCEEWRVQ